LTSIPLAVHLAKYGILCFGMVNSWLLYRKISIAQGKKYLSFANFRAEIAYCLAIKEILLPGKEEKLVILKKTSKQRKHSLQLGVMYHQKMCVRIDAVYFSPNNYHLKQFFMFIRCSWLFIAL
jgi:hypothetical protein